MDDENGQRTTTSTGSAPPVYRNCDIEQENEAPVALTVDAANGPIADAIKIHPQDA